MTSVALQHALDRICTADGLGGEFGLQAFHKSRKRRTRRLLAAGPSDREVQLRYGWLAEIAQANRWDLDGALIVLARAHATNTKFNCAVRLYASSFRMMNRESIFQMRLVLRFMRRHASSQFPYVVGVVTTPQRYATAAE